MPIEGDSTLREGDTTLSRMIYHNNNSIENSSNNLNNNNKGSNNSKDNNSSRDNYSNSRILVSLFKEGEG